LAAGYVLGAIMALGGGKLEVPKLYEEESHPAAPQVKQEDLADLKVFEDGCYILRQFSSG